MAWDVGKGELEGVDSGGALERTSSIRGVSALFARPREPRLVSARSAYKFVVRSTERCFKV